MSSTLDYPTFNRLIEQVLVTEPGTKKTRAVGEAVGYMMNTGVLGIWANSLANQNNYHDYYGRQDLVGVIAEKMVITLRDSDKENTTRVRAWVDYLHGHAKNTVMDYLGSGQVTPASGMSGVVRRASSAKLAQRELVAKLGREPSRAEIIEHANAHLHATRKNPKRQGALISDADFSPVSSVSMTVFEDTDSAVPGAIRQENTIEEKVEAALAAKRLLERCKAAAAPEDAQKLMVVASHWIELQLQGESVSIVRMATDTNMSRVEAKRLLELLTDVLDGMREEAAVAA